MQVTETLSQGLKREYNIVLSASDLASRLDAQLADLKTKVKINGFRPGKVPVAHLKRVYGRSVMSDVVQEAITAANKQIVDDNGLRLAQEPKVELPTDKDAIEAALEARGDLAFKVALEVLPKFEVGEFSDLDARAAGRRSRGERSRGGAAAPRAGSPHLRRQAGGRPRRKTSIASRSISSARSTASRSRAAPSEDIEVVLGSKTFIPGFEEQLLGAVAGERRAVQATFPEAYAARKLAGQKADFDVTVKAVAAPEPLRHRRRIRQELRARKASISSRRRCASASRADYARASREKVKRKLLDALAARYSFEVPEGPGRAGVRLDLGAGRARAAGLGPHASPTKTPPRRRRAPNIAPSPSAACAWGCCSPRSAPRRTSRSATRK